MTSHASTDWSKRLASPAEKHGHSPRWFVAEQVVYRCLLALAVAGFVLRLVVIGISHGSNDMGTWHMFAKHIDEHGLQDTYRALDGFNHPPLMGWLSVAAEKLSDWSGIPFRIWWKVPPLLADAFALRLLWTRFLPRGRLWAAAAVALFSCNPVSIAITAFHGNTDSLCAVLFLYAALLHERERRFAAGLALAAALNVKVIALLFVPALLLLCRSWREAARFLSGLALGALPLLTIVALVPEAFYRNAIAYNSHFNHWGLSGWALQSKGQFPKFFRLISVDYRQWGRFVVIAAIAGCSLLGRLRHWGAVRSATTAMAVFLFLTPGFGIQYTVWVVPLLAATSLRHSLRWALPCGLFVALTYYSFLVDEWPLRSVHRTVIGYPMGSIGLLAWAALGLYLWEQMKRGEGQVHQTS